MQHSKFIFSVQFKQRDWIERKNSLTKEPKAKDDNQAGPLLISNKCGVIAHSEIGSAIGDAHAASLAWGVIRSFKSFDSFVRVRRFSVGRGRKSGGGGMWFWHCRERESER